MCGSLSDWGLVFFDGFDDTRGDYETKNRSHRNKKNSTPVKQDTRCHPSGTLNNTIPMMIDTDKPGNAERQVDRTYIGPRRERDCNVP